MSRFSIRASGDAHTFSIKFLSLEPRKAEFWHRFIKAVRKELDEMGDVEVIRDKTVMKEPIEDNSSIG